MASQGSECMKQLLCVVVGAAAICLSQPLRAVREPDGRKIDSSHSKITVHVLKSGVFSAFAHNHEIDAPIEGGEVDESGAPSVELRVDARKLRVVDSEASTDTRAKIQETMLGPQVLDGNRFPDIHFKSTQVEAQGADHWLVRGNLDLHGQTHPVAVGVSLKDGIYRGTAAVKQTDFGIKPVSIAGGSVNVKDEVKIEFEIAVSQ